MSKREPNGVERHLRKPAHNWVAYSLVFTLACSLGGGAFWLGQLDNRVGGVELADVDSRRKAGKADDRLQKIEKGQVRIETEQKSQKEQLNKLEKKVDEGNRKLDQLKDLLIRGRR